jgi:hypothetical protein
MNSPFLLRRTRFRQLTFAFLSIPLFLSGKLLNAATFYLSNSGSDQYSGKTDSTPFATLAFVKTKMAARDTLLLKRGDVFRDSLDLSSVADPVIGAYGPATQPPPVVNGSASLNQWTIYKGNIWVTPCNKRIEKLFANNALMTLARYPDTGWLRIDTVTENSDGSNTKIKVAALKNQPRNAAQYWTNAQIRWRRWSWWYETRRIAGYDGAGMLSLDGKSIIHIMGDSGCKGWHFYIDNKFEELDAPGEWYYDSAAHKVYFYPPAGTDPTTLLIEGSYLSKGIILAGGAVGNICFRQQNLNGLSFSKTSTVTNCRFEGIGGESGGAALAASWDIANSKVTGCVFENNLNTGISWYENSGRKGKSSITLDTLRNTGSFPGYGGSGTWHAVGILVHLSSNVQICNNYIDKTGYAGILLGSDSNFVYNNIIKRAMWTLNDGGAIYTDCNKSYIHHNIIYDTRGDLSSSGPWYPLGHGIWLEFLGDFRQSVVQNNTIVRSGCNGIYLPNNFSDTIRNNVLFDNAVAQIDLDGQTTNGDIQPPRTANLPQNNVITGNVCFAANRSQKAFQFRPEFNYGTFDGNYLCDPYTDSVASGYGTGNHYYTVYDYTLSQWRSLYPWADKTAKTDPCKRPRGLAESNPYGKGVIFINESSAAKIFSATPGQYKDLDGNPVTAPFTVQPFESKVLVRADSTASVKQPGNFSNGSWIVQKPHSLEYRLAERCAVSFSLFSLAGRLVRIRKELRQAPGIHTVLFSDLKFAPGIYQYEFRAESSSGIFSKRGKIVLSR